MLDSMIVIDIFWYFQYLKTMLFSKIFESPALWLFTKFWVISQNLLGHLILYLSHENLTIHITILGETSALNSIIWTYRFCQKIFWKLFVPLLSIWLLICSNHWKEPLKICLKSKWNVSVNKSFHFVSLTHFKPARN